VEKERERRYEVVRPYEVRIAGLDLEVDGLAYQQQDGAAAVCASTALWSALQQVARLAGHRTPTPSAVTAAAASPFPPSHGLDYREMAGALARLGYIADQFVPGERRELFRAKLVACLASRLPVILILTRQQTDTPSDAAHAVTVTGFARVKASGLVRISQGDGLTMRSGTTEIVYVHDDNLGSHAHYELRDSDEIEHDRHRALLLHRGGGKQGAWWTPDDWVVSAALVPKPEKLRMPIEHLFATAFGLRRVVAQAFEGLDVDYAVRFDLGVHMIRALFTQGFDAERLAEFVSSLELPRHVGVVSVFRSGTDERLCDLLLDATDVVPPRRLARVLAIVAPKVPERSAPERVLREYCTKEFEDCPLIAAPAATTSAAVRAHLARD
jgi:hypothetical protein